MVHGSLALGSASPGKVAPVANQGQLQLRPRLDASLSTLFLVSVFVPFVRIPGLSFETSVLASLASLLVLASSWRHFVQTPDSLRLFLLLVLLPIGANVGLLTSNQGYFSALLRMYSSFAQGFLVYYVTKNYSFEQLPVTTRNLIYLWIVVGFLQLTPIGPALSQILAVVFTRSAVAGGDRGIQILANEPSYAVIHLLYFIPLVAMLGLKNQRLILFLLLILVFATRSANGILLLAGLLFLNLIIFRRTRILLIVFGLGVVGFFLAPFFLDLMDGRAASILRIALRNPQLLLADDSIASRYSIILANYMGWLTNPFLGTGLGSFSVTQGSIFQQYSISSYEISRVAELGGVVPYMSFLGGLLNDLGCVGGFLYFLLFLRPGLKTMDKNSKVLIWFTVFIQLQTISFSLPIQWFILGLMANPARHHRS